MQHNCNNPMERWLRNRILQQGLRQEAMLKMLLLAKMVGKGGKCSSLWPRNQGTTKYLARSQWCSPCGSGPCVEPACPHLRAENHQHHARLPMLKKSKEGKDPCDCTGKLLEETKNNPEQLTLWHLNKDETQLHRATQWLIKIHQTHQIQIHQQGLLWHIPSNKC